MRLPLLLVLVGALLQSASAEPSAIFLVRHAERADPGGVRKKDPDLSRTGRARAQALAETLRDAKISAIYTTEFHRTQETAKPLAEQLGLQPRIVSAKERKQLIAAVKRGDGNILVVGHSDTLPEIMRALGVAEPPTLGEHDYDNLFVILRLPEPRPPTSLFVRPLKLHARRQLEHVRAQSERTVRRFTGEEQTGADALDRRHAIGSAMDFSDARTTSGGGVRCAKMRWTMRAVPEGAFSS